MKIGIVGVGNLGGSLAEMLLAAGFCRDDMMLVARGSSAAADRCSKLGLLPHNIEVLRAVDVVVVAVKPQDAVTVCAQMKPVLANTSVVISMMAGVPCGVISELCGHLAVARAMPNLGVVVGQSATAYYASMACTTEQIRLIERVVQACGKAYRVSREDLIDVATAVAGSGPAYLCWLGEQMEQVAISAGFSGEDAHAMVLQTFKGAVSYLEHGGEAFSEMRARVTSPHGTTAAALGVLRESNSDVCIRAAVQAALERSRELGTISHTGTRPLHDE